MIVSMNPISRFSILVILAVFGLAACGAPLEGNADRQATLQALGTQAALRVTAHAAEGGAEIALQEAQLKATQTFQALDATQAALSALDEASLQATSAAFAPYQAELPRYGVDPERGRPGWIHPPVSLDLNGKYQYDYANQFLGTVAADFVVSADITWNTQYGGSGCGFVLRSDGNKDALNQYLVIATRGSSGHVVFLTMANGEVVTGQDFYAYGLDPQFDWHNDTTNQLTVVGRGNEFSLYTNGTKLGVVDPTAPPPQPYFPPSPEKPADKTDLAGMAAYTKAQAEYQTVVNQMRAQYAARVKAYRMADKTFERGLVAMVALAESGRTQCQFENAWLWLIKE